MKPIGDKRFIYFFVLLGVMALGTYGYFQAGRPQSPKLEVTPENYDFGEIQPEPIDREFQLKNTGGAPLQIKRVTTSCSCTSGEIKDRTIEPGKSSSLVVTFDPTAMDPPIRGEVLRMVYIQTNDPDREEVRIKITANVSGGE
ncbi:DUF1573 domain-containing protein [Candidatus Bipolaricaulota bacterium]|nr:DUF1573 domain-containing protein [Candidatus Bipolaricaulota bacterium]